MLKEIATKIDKINENNTNNKNAEINNKLINYNNNDNINGVKELDNAYENILPKSEFDTKFVKAKIEKNFGNINGNTTSIKP